MIRFQMMVFHENGRDKWLQPDVGSESHYRHGIEPQVLEAAQENDR